MMTFIRNLTERTRVGLLSAAVCVIMLAVVACVLWPTGDTYALEGTPNERWTTGDRSAEGVDASDANIVVVYFDAFGAGETGYVFGKSENATVADLLKYCDITLQDNTDTLSVGRDVLMTTGMHITLTRTEYSTETVTEVIPHEVEEIDIVYSAFSRSYTDVAGKDGERVCTYAVKTVNGKTAEKILLAETVTAEPVTEVRYVDCRNLLTLTNPLTGETGAPTQYDDKLRIRFTAYNYGETGGAVTATGTKTQVGYVAVDPTVIPYYSLLYIVLDNGFVYGYAYAMDCGGGIKGNRIDVFLPTYEDMDEFGVKDGTCYIVRRGK